jgi:hypothetical protein
MLGALQSKRYDPVADLTAGISSVLGSIRGNPADVS